MISCKSRPTLTAQILSVNTNSESSTEVIHLSCDSRIGSDVLNYSDSLLLVRKNTFKLSYMTVTAELGVMHGDACR